MIVVPKVAQRLWLTCVLDYLRGATAGGGELFILRLYVNDFAPIATTVLADFTEAGFPGYASKQIGALFPFPVNNADDQAESTCPLQTFSATSQDTSDVVHGWYCTFQSDLVPSLLFAAERIVPAVRMNLPGASVPVQPSFTLASRFN
jgi:hypothetical protein